MTAPGASAELEVAGDKATLVAENLPTPPEGRVYEVWVQPKGPEDTPPEPTNVLFVPRGDGSAEAAIPGSVSDMQQVHRHRRAADRIGHADRRRAPQRGVCPRAPRRAGSTRA